MDHDYIKFQREQNPSIKLLKADNGPLIVSFLFQEFKKNTKVTISHEDLVSSLSDYLYALRGHYGDAIYPETAQQYLDAWSNEQFLRKYYPPEGDEPAYELTPSSEKALEWFKDLDKREFIGTESRLLKIIDILKEIVYKNSDDPEKRIQELEKQRGEIAIEIDKIRSGIIDKFSQTQIRERYFDVYDTAHKLLSDFKQVEYNFRDLDRKIREKQIESNIKKGEMLDDIFKNQDIFLDSDQGRSFQAFWQLLMSQDKQDELKLLIEIASSLPEIQDIKKDDFLEDLSSHLIEAGDKVNKTNHSLIEQLRKYLDDRAYLENKRMIDLIKEIKALAIQVKDTPPGGKEFLAISGRPSIEMVMERPLWDIPRNPELNSIDVEGDFHEVIDVQALFTQYYVNPEDLRKRIETLLENTSQISLREIIDAYPVERGLAEILIYMNIASKNEKAFINENLTEELLVWNKNTQRCFRVSIPQIIYCK